MENDGKSFWNHFDRGYFYPLYRRIGRNFNTTAVKGSLKWVPVCMGGFRLPGRLRGVLWLPSIR